MTAPSQVQAATQDATFSSSAPSFETSALISGTGPSRTCHCTPNQACHADSIIKLFRQTVLDRDDPTTGPPSSETLGYLALLLTEAEEDEGSSPDEGDPPKEAGRKGKG